MNEDLTKAQEVLNNVANWHDAAKAAVDSKRRELSTAEKQLKKAQETLKLARAEYDQACRKARR